MALKNHVVLYYIFSPVFILPLDSLELECKALYEMSYAFFQKSSLILLEKWPDIFENEINGSFVDWCKNISLNLLFLAFSMKKKNILWCSPPFCRRFAGRVWVSFVVFQIWGDLPNMDIKLFWVSCGDIQIWALSPNLGSWCQQNSPFDKHGPGHR